MGDDGLIFFGLVLIIALLLFVALPNSALNWYGTGICESTGHKYVETKDNIVICDGLLEIKKTNEMGFNTETKQWQNK